MTEYFGLTRTLFGVNGALVDSTGAGVSTHNVSLSGGATQSYDFPTGAGEAAAFHWNNDGWPTSGNGSCAVVLSTTNMNITVKARLFRDTGSTKYYAPYGAAVSVSSSPTTLSFPLSVSDITTGLACSNELGLELFFTNTSAMSTQTCAVTLYYGSFVESDKSSNNTSNFVVDPFVSSGGSCAVSSATVIPTVDF
jgi:hypothetical protein